MNKRSQFVIFKFAFSLLLISIIPMFLQEVYGDDECSATLDDFSGCYNSSGDHMTNGKDDPDEYHKALDGFFIITENADRDTDHLWYKSHYNMGVIYRHQDEFANSLNSFQESFKSSLIKNDADLWPDVNYNVGELIVNKFPKDSECVKAVTLLNIAKENRGSKNNFSLGDVDVNLNNAFRCINTEIEIIQTELKSEVNGQKKKIPYDSNVSANGIGDLPLNFQCLPASNSEFEVGMTKVKCSIKNNNGYNVTEEKIFTIYLEDITPPIPQPLPPSGDDQDKDGILDKNDVCPLVPENYNGYKDDDGCYDEPIPKCGLDQLWDGQRCVDESIEVIGEFDVKVDDSDKTTKLLVTGEIKDSKVKANEKIYFVIVNPTGTTVYGDVVKTVTVDLHGKINGIVSLPNVLPPDTYQISGTYNGKSIGSVNFTIPKNDEFSFQFIHESNLVNITAGRTAFFTVQTIGNDNSEQVHVTCDIKSLYSEECKVDPAIHEPPGEISIAIKTSKDTKVGEYSITITGNSTESDTSNSITLSSYLEKNIPPIVEAGSDQNVESGELVSLKGTVTNDNENDEVNCEWIIISGNVTLSDQNNVLSWFKAPDVSTKETLQFELRCNDGLDDDSDTVQITVTPAPDITTNGNGEPNWEMIGAIGTIIATAVAIVAIFVTRKKKD